MGKRVVSSIIWGAILIGLFLIFVLQTSPGDRENFSQNPWAFVPFLLPWFLGLSVALFVVATALSVSAFSPLDLIVMFRKKQNEQIENVRNIGARVDEIKVEAKFSVEEGVVVSSETIPVTDIKGGFSGGGGQINSIGAGHTAGHIGSVHGSISSVTTLIAKFFVKIENSEYHVQLDSKDFQVREGSKVKVHWISHGGYRQMFRIVNLDTSQQVVFESAVTGVFHDIASAKIAGGGNYYGINIQHLLAQVRAKVLSDE